MRRNFVNKLKKGCLIIFSGPSGAGKDTILSKVMAKKDNLKLSISHTTRVPRENEVNGKSYYFVSEKEFMEMVKNGEMLEYAKYCGNYYGTSVVKVKDELEKGNDVILEIEVQGAEQVMKKIPEALSIFVLPPSLDELKIRLKNRGTDSDEVINRRVKEAENEIALAHNYDYVIINDDIEKSVEQEFKIIELQEMKSQKMKHIIDEVLNSEKNINR
ncbi:MAG: guanylate kinase [Clostridia bacterium]|nr:guanylate kinase [Clostridia bacterium]